MPRTLLAILCAVVLAPGLRAEELTLRVLGLFSPDRVPDLREVFEEIPELKLVKVDFDRSEMTVAFDGKKAFPGAKPEQLPERVDQKLRQASRSTFGARPRGAVARDKLQLVVIGAKGLDCKGCCLAAYEAIATLDGVERATASFREGKVTALIDPQKTDRGKLREALRKKGVALDKE